MKYTIGLVFFLLLFAQVSMAQTCQSGMYVSMKKCLPCDPETYSTSKNVLSFTSNGKFLTKGLSVPSTAVEVRCAAPQDGTSAVFNLNESQNRKTLNVVAKKVC